MAIERFAIAFAVLFVGCGGIRGDLADVRSATHASLPDVGGSDVEPDTSNEVRAMLGKSIDADTAVRIALLNNRELRATLREMGIARGRLVQAGLLPNPAGEMEVTPEQESNLILRAEWDVTRLLLTPLRARAYGPDVDAARYRAAAAVVATGYLARSAFYDAQGMAQKVAAAHRELDALAASRDAAQALFESGNVTALDLAQEEAAYQGARADVADIELESQLAREALVRALGLHGADAGFAISGDLPSIPEKIEAGEDIESKALRASFDLQARRTKIEGLARRAGYTRFEGWLPDVTVDVHALQPRDATTGRVPDRPWLAGAGFRTTVPLFDRQQGTASVLEAEAGAELERFYGAAIALRSQARASYERLATAHARARLYETTIVPARQKVVEQAVLQYNAMRISIFELLSSRRIALRATLGNADASASYWKARAAFDALLAGQAPLREMMRASSPTIGEE